MPDQCLNNTGHVRCVGLLDSKLQLEKSHDMGRENKMYSVDYLSAFEYGKYFSDSNAC